MKSRTLSVHPLRGIGEVLPGDDLPQLFLRALKVEGLAPEAGDVLVVTSKIVSKAEDRFVTLAGIDPGPEAEAVAARVGKDPRLVELVLRESIGVVRAAPGVLITRHRLGLVTANAGIDRSNLGSGEDARVLLLPIDPDRSAAELRRVLSDLLGADLPVVLADSFGRPWRQGVVNVAVGASGVPALVDRRGEADRDGRRLEVTQVALADLIACAAGLVCGEGAEGVPAALVKGLALNAPERPAAELVRPLEQDLFR